MNASVTRYEQCSEYWLSPLRLWFEWCPSKSTWFNPPYLRWKQAFADEIS